MAGRSVVEYFGKHERYSCGYCKSVDKSYSHGMWGHCLMPQDYQDLINRGWRRSGKYCYKPIMTLTCCPQYTIRCETLAFKLSKSQKKILKRMKNFLLHGQKKNDSMREQSSSPSNETHDAPMDCAHVPEFDPDQRTAAKEDVESFLDQNRKGMQSGEMSVECKKDLFQESETSDVKTATNPASGNNIVAEKISCKGPDPNRPRCKKAKEIRRERQKQKLLKSGINEEEASQIQSKQKCSEKTLEDFIADASVGNPVHQLELRLVPCNISNSQFSKTFEQSHALYQKYQTAVHRDPPEKCNETQFNRFLVTNPFQFSDEATSSHGFYGSFHQQYWLDDKLIAVGVIDILPHCISSVYFYYDPDYGFLSLGTYAALREIALVKEFHTRSQDLKYYYMGFYIHSCPKMKYKGSYYPSFLLCPETYQFQPLEMCIPKLTVSKYSRLEENDKILDSERMVHFKEVLILYQRQVMNYVIYCNLKRHTDEEEEIREYATLIGRKCYKRILLYRS